ncbi:hypothetical protein DRP07_07160 [Archaeoglobales archaeon]|nr:MAG: hypothetical protein DRP07_07160 [Archaeoglobales archaeon]
MIISNTNVLRLSCVYLCRLRIVWSPSISTDVIGYNLYRREAGETTYIKVNQELIPDTVFIDYAPLGRIIVYAATAIDSAGNESFLSTPDSIQVRLGGMEDGRLKMEDRGLREVGGSHSRGTNLTLYFYHTDHLGSPRVITNIMGEKVAEYEYLPFGFKKNGKRSVAPFAFTGKPKDEESGLQYFGKRYYDQFTRRFQTVDHPGNFELLRPEVLNPFNYCSNNPIRYIDPSGKDKMETWEADYIKKIMEIADIRFSKIYHQEKKHPTTSEHIEDRVAGRMKPVPIGLEPRRWWGGLIEQWFREFWDYITSRNDFYRLEGYSYASKEELVYEDKTERILVYLYPEPPGHKRVINYIVWSSDDAKFKGGGFVWYCGPKRRFPSGIFDRPVYIIRYMSAEKFKKWKEKFGYDQRQNKKR